jgi:hypothetical protein
VRIRWLGFKSKASKYIGVRVAKLATENPPMSSVRVTQLTTETPRCQVLSRDARPPPLLDFQLEQPGDALRTDRCTEARERINFAPHSAAAVPRCLHTSWRGHATRPIFDHREAVSGLRAGGRRAQSARVSKSDSAMGQAACRLPRFGLLNMHPFHALTNATSSLGYLSKDCKLPRTVQFRRLTQ